MELEVFDALRSAGVAEDRARAAAEAFGHALDRHAALLVTRVEFAEFRVEMLTALARLDCKISQVEAKLAEVKAELVRWVAMLFVAQIVAVGVLVKLLH